jgi:hypothetical protein
VLELDHVFCFVPPDGDWAGRLGAAGWSLDAGTVHEGQGTRNRRLVLARQYLELAWVTDADEARGNPLRLDRRADWRATGASPFGFGLRGVLTEAEREEFWPYDLLGLPIWVHRDNERMPDRPLVFVLEVDPEQRRRPPEAAGEERADLVAVRHAGPVPPALPPYTGPAVEHTVGPHRLEVVVDRGTEVRVTELLAIGTMAP